MLTRWALASRDQADQEAVVVAANPRLPHLSARKWEAATHKAVVVHEVATRAN